MPYYQYTLERIWEEIIVRSVWIAATIAGISIAICLLIDLIDTLYRRSIERKNRAQSSTPSQEPVLLTARRPPILNSEMSERPYDRLYDGLPISPGRLHARRSQNDPGD